MSALPVTNPAEIYEDCFVPAMFGQWGPVIAAAAEVNRGHRVLDVACGTGALTRAVAERTGDPASVTGLDINAEMLAVARSRFPAIDWREGPAEALPFADASFDRVVSQFAMMFFVDPAGALREMRRVLRAEGTIVVAVCDALDHSPGYAVFAELLDRLFGADVARSFRAPFALGDRARLAAIARDAGLAGASVARIDGSVSFASPGALVTTEGACVWTLGGLLDADQLKRLEQEAQESLAPFITDNGRLEFVMPALVLTARAGA